MNLDGPTRRINTGYGPLDVPEGLLRIWNRYGWPREEVLREMAENGPAVGVPQTGDPR
jgi:hypothetical protein